MVIEITPTLIIGIGGTGHFMTQRLRKEFDETTKNIPVIQYISLDVEEI
jgi:hypothetical protein